MTTYKIATLGGFLIATASTDDLLRQRAEREIAEAGLDASFDDLSITDGLTLFASRDDATEAEENGATILYSGTSQGWLQDDEGRMEYYAAGRI